MTWLTTWNPAVLAEFSGRMLDAERMGDPFTLELADGAIAPEAQPSAIRINMASAQILSNLLLGRFRDLPLEVQLPENRGLNLQLARAGLFFALSNGPKVSWLGGTPAGWANVADVWAAPFHPDDTGMYQEALSPGRDLTADAWVVRAAFQRYLLSVMHPHRRPVRSLRNEIQFIAKRWLSTRLDVKQGSDLVATLVDCAEIFYEIVVNVPDHAGLGAMPNGASLGQVYATLGGGRESHNRLH